MAAGPGKFQQNPIASQHSHSKTRSPTSHHRPTSYPPTPTAHPPPSVTVRSVEYRVVFRFFLTWGLIQTFSITYANQISRSRISTGKSRRLNKLDHFDNRDRQYHTSDRGDQIFPVWLDKAKQLSKCRNVYRRQLEQDHYCHRGK